MLHLELDEGRYGPELGCVECRETGATQYGGTATYMLAEVYFEDCGHRVVAIDFLPVMSGAAWPVLISGRRKSCHRTTNSNEFAR